MFEQRFIYQIYFYNRELLLDDSTYILDLRLGAYFAGMIEGMFTRIMSMRSSGAYVLFTDFSATFFISSVCFKLLIDRIMLLERVDSVDVEDRLETELFLLVKSLIDSRCRMLLLPEIDGNEMLWLLDVVIW